MTKNIAQNVFLKITYFSSYLYCVTFVINPWIIRSTIIQNDSSVDKAVIRLKKWKNNLSLLCNFGLRSSFEYTNWVRIDSSLKTQKRVEKMASNDVGAEVKR